MNQKAYSVLFCALLASTFVHELKAKGVAPVSSRLGRVLERSSSTEVCILECTLSQSINITFGITIQVVEEVLVLANLSANAALLIDASNQIVVLLNGTSGAGVALNITSQTGVYVSSGLWVSSSSSIEAYIKGLSGGLKSILSISGAVSFSVKSVSKAILTVINNIVARLVINIGLSIKQDITVGLVVILSISRNIISLLRGSLSGLLVVIATKVISFSLDIAAFVNVLVGIEIVVVKVAGSFTALIEAGVSLNWSALLEASNGLILFGDLLLGIRSQISLGASLGAVLNDTESALKLIAQLGGNTTIGISGAITLVASLVGLINKSISLEVFIHILVQFVANNSHYVKENLTATLVASLQGLLLVINRLNASAEFAVLVVIIKGLIAGSWIYKSVNIGEIVLKLAAGAALSGAKLLQLIVSVLVKISVVVALSTSIPTLVLVLILSLNSAIGAWLLIVLGISISTSLLSVAGGILSVVLSGAISIIVGLLTGSIYTALIRISVFGTIINAIGVAYQAVVSSESGLSVIINGSSQFRIQILAVIQSISGVSLGSSSSAVASATSLLKSTSSVSAYIGVSVSGSVSVSG